MEHTLGTDIETTERTETGGDWKGQARDQDSGKALVQNVASLGILQVANYLLPLVTVPYLVRVLGPENFGRVAFAQAFINYFVILTDYGFNFTATREIAINRGNPRKVSEIFSAVMVIKTGLMVVSFMVMAATVLAVPKFRADYPLYFVTFSAVLGSVLFPVWLFQGLERMKYITILNISAKTIAVAAIFAFVKGQSDYRLAAGIQAGGTALAGVLSLCVVRGWFPVRLLQPARPGNIAIMMREGAQVFIATVSGNVYGQGAVFITGMLAGNVAAGYYAVARTIAGALSSLVQPVAQAVYPHLTRMFADGSKRYDGFRKTVLLVGGLVSLLASSIVLIFSSPIAALVAGETSPLLNTLVKILGLGITLDAMNVLLNTFILSMKRYAEMQRMYVWTAALFLLTSIPATHWFGARGMAYTMLVVVEVFVLARSIQIARILNWSKGARS